MPRISRAEQIMKTRKQQTPKKGGARPQPAKRAAARARPAVTRGRAASAKRIESRVREDGSVTLAADCTVAEADALKSELARRLDEPGAVTMDVTALQRIDTAGLQLLAAFVRDRRLGSEVRRIAPRSPVPYLRFIVDRTRRRITCDHDGSRE